MPITGITGTTMLVRTTLTNPVTKEPQDAAPGTLSLLVVDPNGIETTYSQEEVSHEGTGRYRKELIPNISGLWHGRWVVAGEAADEFEFEMESAFREGEEPDLTDLRVLVPKARRACEGPYGAPQGRPPLADDQLNGMIADGCSEIILFTGSLFGQELDVKKRDPLGGFPTEWKVQRMLTEWEGALIVCQVGLDYFHHLFRDMKTSESLKNEGTEWTYSLSANVLRNYLDNLKEQRDMALQGLRLHHPVMDVYASNIRVRDQATVAVLEWWDTASPAISGGVPGGQEAAVIPWTPGWTGPGWGP